MSGPRLNRIARWAFAAQLAVLDLRVRGIRAFASEPRLVLGLGASVALLYLVSTLATRRAARAAIAAALGTLVVVEIVYARYYHDAIGAQAIACAVHNFVDVRRVIVPMLPSVAAGAAALTALEWLVLGCAVRGAAEGGPRRRIAVLVLAASIALGPKLGDATPEVRLAHASGLLFAKDEARSRGAVDVPPLPSTREELPSVVLVLTESVRATSYVEAVSREVRAAAPERMEIPQMRALSSYTAVSFSALVTGRTQEGPREQIFRAPTVFDLLRAVRGRDRRVTVAYWSAQSESVFERDDARASIDSFATVETLVGHAVADEDEVVDQGVDRLLMEHAIREMPKLPRPFFLVLHFAGTHAPYFVDPAHAPFVPYKREVAWSGLAELHNAYEDAIFEQDRSIAASLRAFRGATAGGPWAMIFTSDHGESFGERGAIHHGQNLYDEQLHVPAWVAHGGGALTEEEAARLATNAGGWRTHLDLLPTILDLYGALDGYASAPYKRALAGASLIGPADASRGPLPITNCTAMFRCPINTWGMLDGDRALLAQRWDEGWKCVDLRAALEIVPDARCAALREASQKSFAELPNGRPNR